MKALVAVLPGDGIGPEVMREGIRVLEAIGDVFGHDWELRQALIGGAAIDEQSAALPGETRTLCAGADAVLLGAVGGPRWSHPARTVRPEDGLLALRQELGVYANIRPVVPLPQGIAVSPLRPERLENVDLVVVRELTGGLYFGQKHRATSPDGGVVAWETCRYTSSEIERVVRVAARLARQRRGKLCSVDKANVLETSRLWREVTTRVICDEFPDVELEHAYVDACAMYLVLDPRRFDVIVTENLFGDILTDESAVLAGAIGLLPSASLGDAPVDGGARRGLYEPIHGSAPDIAGRGIANPVGMILSVAMMLRHSFGLDQEARAVETAVSGALAAGWLTADLIPDGHAGRSTAEAGAEIARRVRVRVADPLHVA